MTTKHKIFLLAGIITLVILAKFLFFGGEDASLENVSEEAEYADASSLTYESEKYGFSFSYPSSLSLKVNTGEHLTLREASSGSIVVKAEILVVKSEPNPEQPFEELALDETRLLCARSGVDVSRNCLEVLYLKDFFDAKGQKFSLRTEEKLATTGEVKYREIGPFFTLNVSENTPDRVSFVIIHPPLDEPIFLGDASLLEDIAKTLTVRRMH